MRHGKSTISIAFATLSYIVLAACGQTANSQGDVIAQEKARFAVREQKLLKACEEMATEREILIAKYNAMIASYNLDMPKEPFPTERCS